MDTWQLHHIFCLFVPSVAQVDSAGCNFYFLYTSDSYWRNYNNQG